MKTFLTDENNDFAIGASGNFELISDAAALSQILVEYAQTAREEMVTQQTQGMPFFATAFGRTANIAQYEAAFRKRMMDHPDVTGVLAFFGEINEGVLSYQAVIQSVYGQIEVNNG